MYFWHYLEPILGPFWDPVGDPLGAKIVKKWRAAKEGGGLSRRLRAEGAQGHPQTHKIDPHSTPRPPKRFQNGASGALAAAQTTHAPQKPLQEDQHDPQTPKIHFRITQPTENSKTDPKHFILAGCLGWWGHAVA